ncbi:MEMO1 family protein [Patescibacteria group bacterium]|nr:MEMO1 family protein [Patescibacteria group bacterium]
MIVFACFSPHPPLILPTVGSPADRRKVAKTIKALESLAPQLTKTKPDLIIISSPHSDWGCEVPLFFLNPTHQPYTIKAILTDFESPQVHFQRGKEIINNIPKNKKVAWIASGDMSHRLKEDGPYGFHPSGPQFDQEFIRLLKNKDIQAILNLNSRLIEEAGECGLRSFSMLLGALSANKTDWQPEVLSYEGPFGVGYLVVNFKIKKK